MITEQRLDHARPRQELSPFESQDRLRASYLCDSFTNGKSILIRAFGSVWLTESSNTLVRDLRTDAFSMIEC
jgi:hypothetical protein